MLPTGETNVQLPFPARPLVVDPLPGRAEPRLWFQRLVIWGKPDCEPIREVTFHPGLNIIWAHQGAGAPNDTALPFDPGKTILVRLMRYCLGEDQLGIAADEGKIRVAFPAGAVGSVIRVDGKPFSIIRSFGEAKASIAQQGDRLEDVWNCFATSSPSAGIAPFLQAVQLAFAPKPDPALADVWGAVLNFVARDHAGGFAEVLRGHTHGNNSGRLIAQEIRIKVLCQMLGLGDPEEFKRSRSSGEETKSSSLEAGPVARAMIAAISKRQSIPGGKSLTISELWKLLEERSNKVLDSIQNYQATINTIEGNCAQLEKERFELTLQVVSLKTLLKSSEERLPELSAELEEFRKHLISPRDKCPTCNLEIDEAISRGCLMPSAGYDPNTITLRIAEKNAQIASLEQGIRDHNKRLKDLDRDIRKNKTLIKESEETLKRIRNRLKKSRDYQAGVSIDIGTCERLRDATRAAPNVVPALAGSTEHAPDGRRHTAFQRGVEEINAVYSQIVGELVCAQATGALRFKWDDLDACVSTESEQNDSVVNLLKILAFDFAVLVRAIQTDIPAPGLLIHDSPRVEDIPDDQYSKLFALALKLELPRDKSSQAAPVQEPLQHQYIITTSTPPPCELQSNHYVRLHLDAQLLDESGLLFKKCL